MNYSDFLEKKKHLIGDFGFEPNYFPEMAFDFQRHIIEKAVKTCEAMEIACLKISDSDKVIRYFCGVCWNMIKQNENGHL